MSLIPPKLQNLDGQWLGLSVLNFINNCVVLTQTVHWLANHGLTFVYNSHDFKKDILWTCLYAA